MAARRVNHIPGIKVPYPALHPGGGNFFGFSDQRCQDSRFVDSCGPELQGKRMTFSNLLRKGMQDRRGDPLRIGRAHAEVFHLRAHVRIG